MNNLSRELQEILSTQINLTQDLERLLLNQRDALAQFNVDEADEQAHRIQEIVTLVEALEEQRTKITSQLWCAIPNPHPRTDESAPSLKDILFYLDDDSARALSGLAKRLATASKQLHQVNLQNRMLIDHSRRFVKETIRLVTASLPKQLVDQKV